MLRELEELEEERKKIDKIINYLQNCQGQFTINHIPTNTSGFSSFSQGAFINCMLSHIHSLNDS
jgi:hypothetical protein